MFSDVPPEHWAAGTIAWAVEHGVAKGYDDGTFRPNDTVTEAEFLAMLINAHRPPMPGKYQHWADPYYAFAEEMNWPVEGAHEIIKRSVEIPRVRVAEIVAAADGVNDRGDDAIRYLIRKGLAKGKKPGEASVESFAGDDLLTRAEAVAFIRNLKESGLKVLKARPN
ncbi:MAG: S-layer homology domain-containing protein [Hydrogenibacillus schlegelii]|uniref:S-layer homology domain-containing protein n=1 Tax=Hydrogenibacillus schlegelii TaxID=1484 RepID=A0A947CVG4_HYDSH|nr:S-layer homology domain-containing protein [Hydrogenibacillus schlegelii]